MVQSTRIVEELEKIATRLTLTFHRKKAMIVYLVSKPVRVMCITSCLDAFLTFQLELNGYQAGHTIQYAKGLVTRETTLSGIS